MNAVKHSGFGVLTLVALCAAPLAARAQDAPPPASEPPPGATPVPAAPPAAGYPPGYGPPPAPGYYPPPPGNAPGYLPPQSPAFVPTPEPTHDGVYVRLHLGGGFTTIHGSDSLGNNVKVSGGSATFGVAVGGAVAPNLALFGTFFVSVASQPDVVSNGYSSGTSNNSLAVGGFGGGVVYYFQPINLYLSGAIAALYLESQDANGNTVYQSDFGPGFQGMVGKEWWVSPHWGLGVAGEFVAATMKDKTDSSIRWDSTSFSIVFSATCF